MRLEYLFLADKAEGINGKLYVLGGGIENVQLLMIPALASYDIALSVKLKAVEAGDHDFQLALEDETGQVLLGPFQSVLTAAAPVGGEESRVMLIVTGPFPVAQAGRYVWRLRVDGNELGEAPINYSASGLSQEELDKLKVGQVIPDPEQEGKPDATSAEIA